MQITLLDAVRDLASARSLDAVIAVVRRSARALTGADGVTFVLREGGDCFYAEEDAIAPLWKGRRFPLEECVSGWVMTHARPAVIPDIEKDPRVPLAAYRATFVKSLALVPVREQEPMAAIGAYWATVHEATADELFTLQALANSAALAIENAQLDAELRATGEREREARLALEQAARGKDEFLATLSHELRTPLNVIQGWLWQLKRPEATPELTRRGLGVIERNLALQIRLVEDLLDVSRAIAGKLQLQPRVLDLVALCEAVVEVIRPDAEARGLRVTLDAPGGDVVARVDLDRMQQVVWNLVTNAVKFTPAGGAVEVVVSREDGWAKVEVRDTGAGLAPRVADDVFKPFWQADSSPTRAYGGLGLGLAIVQQLVHLHGGEVVAASDGPGRGTTMTVRLPLSAVRDESGTWLRRRMEPAAPASPEPETHLDGIRVMVVDDDADACEAVRAILEGHGAVVQTATRAADALQLMAAGLPDVLVSDLAMPEMDGYALLEKVRALGDAARAVPAAALTAFADDDHEQAAAAAGYRHFLAKPVLPAELAMCIATLAAGRPH